MPFKKGDPIKVVGLASPFHGSEGEVVQVDDGTPFPVGANVQVDGTWKVVAYWEHELELLAVDAATEEIPVVHA